MTNANSGFARSDIQDFVSQVSDESESLAHYGIKGMKWGKRKGGVRERLKGARLDANQRKTAIVKRQLEGRGTREERIISAPDKLLLGKDRYNKVMTKKLANLESERARIESGKRTVVDRLAQAYDVSMFDLVVSRQDNKG